MRSVRTVSSYDSRDAPGESPGILTRLLRHPFPPGASSFTLRDTWVDEHATRPTFLGCSFMRERRDRCKGVPHQSEPSCWGGPVGRARTSVDWIIPTSVTVSLKMSYCGRSVKDGSHCRGRTSSPMWPSLVSARPQMPTQVVLMTGRRLRRRGPMTVRGLARAPAACVRDECVNLVSAENHLRCRHYGILVRPRVHSPASFVLLSDL